MDFNKLTIETVGTEEEAVEGLVTALGMKVYGGGECEGEGEGGKVVWGLKEHWEP